MASRSILLSATKRAHSSCPIALKVHEPISVSCFLSMSRLTSMVTSPPSPTKHTVPQVFAERIAASRAAGSAGGVERQIHALSLGQVFDLLFRLQGDVRTELLGELAALGILLDGNDARAHLCAKERGADADGPLSEHRERRAAGEVHAAKRAVGSAGAARDRGARDEGKLIGQRHQRARRHLEVFRMAAVRGNAIHGDPARQSCDQPTRQCLHTPQPA